MKKIYWLAVLPYLAFLPVMAIVNKTEPYVLGFPLIFFWLIFWACAGSAIMFTIYHFDPINKDGDR